MTERKVSKVMLDQVQVITNELGDLCKGAAVSESEDNGMCLQWPAHGVYCEIFDTFEGLETYLVNVFAPDADSVQYSRATSDPNVAIHELRQVLKTRKLE